MAASDAILKERQEIERLFRGVAFKELLRSDLDGDQIVYALREAAKRGVHSIEESNNEDLEIQSVPQLVFGMEGLNQQIQDVLLGCEHIGGDDGDTDVELHPDSKWVGVWAKGGAGKTLLVQNAMNNPVVRAHFNDRVYAVVVGQHPNLVNLQRILCRKINKNEHREISNRDEGKARVRELLSKQKCLLILDDVWQEDHLEWFDVVSEVGCRILITSRNRSVLQRVWATVLRVRDLSSENSMKVLCVHAFGGVERMPAALEKLVKDVVAECRGLPLALKVVGNSLAGKMDSRLWEKALHDLRQAEVPGKNYEEQLFGRLKLSYDNLGNLEQEGKVYKECFLYFAAFPEDQGMSLDDLVQLWCGDGLIGQRETLEMDVEAHSILYELVGRSLIELVRHKILFRSRFIATFKIHDVLRDMGLYILSCGKQPWEQKCLFEPGWRPTTQVELPQGWLSFEDRGDGGKRGRGGCNIMQAKKLSLMSSSVSSLPSRLRANGLTPPLRVLLLNGCNHLTKLDSGFLGHFTNLRVLDLSYTGVRSLPRAIGKLRELVVLNLRGSQIECLTQAIGKLRKLEYLNLYGCRHLCSIPGSGFVSKLVSLKYLNTMDSALAWGTQQYAGALRMRRKDSKMFCRFEALNCLVNLRELRIGDGRKSSFGGSVPHDAMSKLSQIRHVGLNFKNLKELPDGMRNLCAVEELELSLCQTLEQLPGWVAESMGLLKTLRLCFCGRLSQICSELCSLQHLIAIDLDWCDSLRCLPDEFGRPGSFPSLQSLRLSYCENLRAFPELQMGAFPKLAELSLERCRHLQRLPESIGLLGPRLRRLDLESCVRLGMPSNETLAAFLKLEELILSGMPTAVLPSAVASLPSLKILNISDCYKLQILPKPVIGNPDPANLYFPNLQELHAERAASLTSIPVGIIELPKLKVLDVRDCDRLKLTNRVWKAIANRKRRLQILSDF